MSSKMNLRMKYCYILYKTREYIDLANAYIFNYRFYLLLRVLTICPPVVRLIEL